MAAVRRKVVSTVARDMGIESLVMMFRIPVLTDSAGTAEVRDIAGSVVLWPGREGPMRGSVSVALPGSVRPAQTR
jgi:hypothetical protein